MPDFNHHKKQCLRKNQSIQRSKPPRIPSLKNDRTALFFKNTFPLISLPCRQLATKSVREILSPDAGTNDPFIHYSQGYMTPYQTGLRCKSSSP
jgi:hypothetical protein